MPLLSIERHPTPRQLHVFGSLWLLFLATAGALALRRGAPWPVIGALWGLAILVPASAFFYPPLARLVFVGLSYATWPLGWLLSLCLLASVYYLLLTPLGLVLRLAGRDALHRKLEPERASYWQPRPKGRDRSRYFRQF